jgi:hypothetical protein
MKALPKNCMQVVRLSVWETGIQQVLRRINKRGIHARGACMTMVLLLLGCHLADTDALSLEDALVGSEVLALLPPF